MNLDNRHWDVTIRWWVGEPGQGHGITNAVVISHSSFGALHTALQELAIHQPEHYHRVYSLEAHYQQEARF